MTYVWMKYAHTALALVSIAGFLLRGFWMFRASPALHSRAARIAPHIFDTVFLVTGIAMLVMLSLNPFTEAWLVAKFIGLIAYIALGTIALKRGPTLQSRAIAFAAAVAVFAWIFGVALTKSLGSWLTWFTA